MHELLLAIHDGGPQGRSDLALFEFFSRVRTSMDSALGEVALRIAESDAHKRAHYVSATQFVAFAGGTEIAEAHHLIDTARALRDTPEFASLRDDFAAGAISSVKTRAIVEAAELAPDTLPTLLDVAREDTATALLQELRRVKAIANAPKDPGAARKKTYAKLRPAGEFGHLLTAYLSNDMVGAINATLEPVTDQLCKQRLADGTFISRNHCRAEALVELISSGASGKSPRPHVNLVLSLEALLRNEVLQGELCEAVGVGPIPLERMKQLLNHAFINLVVEGAPVTQKPTTTQASRSRYVPAPIKRRMDLRGRECTIRGCHLPARDRDHNVELRDGGVTTYDNLDNICAPHHRMKSRLRLKLVGPRGRRVLVPLDPSQMWGSGSRAGP